MKLITHIFRILVVLFILENVLCRKSRSPHIIVILADDMGWNDIGFHGSSQIRTPNIDALAYNGIILNSHYSQALCTPSRSAFLTGKYPIHTGMQHLVILEPEPWGLPTTEKLMPQFFSEQGYKTHAIGKWHLGFYKEKYTPLRRGFDTFYGYYNGLQDYYTHNVHATFANMTGYDMRRNLKMDFDAKGKYSTDLFTEEAVRLIEEHDRNEPMFLYLSHLAPHSGNMDDPLQAPDEEIAKYAHIPDPERRIYAAMVSMLDKSVGTVVTALREKHMLENSIIVFLSDNGAQTFGIHANHGSNYPLKGMKGTPWDGGSRGVAAIWSPYLKKTQRVFNQTMHITDWLPTLWSAAGFDTKLIGKIDGMDIWSSITDDSKSPRTEMLYNIDDDDNYAAIRRGDWKYVIGTVLEEEQDGWYGDPGRDSIYTYDTSSVLHSPAAVALAGVTTQKQIQEKKSAIGIEKPLNFTRALLTKDIILTLRNMATIECPLNNEQDDVLHHTCNPLEFPCLFNLKDDPCETKNVAADNKLIVTMLQNSILQYRKSMLPPRNLPGDPNADPANWDDNWVSWQDCELVKKQKITGPLSSTAIALLTVLCMLFFIVAVILISVSVKSSAAKKSKMDLEMLSAHDDTSDAPRGVVHILTDNDDKPAHFQRSELSRHHSIIDHSKTIN